MPIENIVTNIISVLALVVSCASVWYCHRNFKMSRYEFDKRRKEEKQAILKADIIIVGKSGTFFLSICNVGKVEAKDISIDFGDIISKHIHVVDKGLTYFPSLQPSNEYKIQMFNNNEESDVCSFQISVSWKDEYSELNSKTFILTVA